MASILNVVTLLALISALVLLSNTMTTLVGEQTAEIAAMKAIGARRRDIRRIYLRTAVLFGVLGSVARRRARDRASRTCWSASSPHLFFGIDAAFGISVPALVASLVVGLVGPPLAALPAVRRAARLPLNEALQASGSAVGGQGRARRRCCGAPRWLPRSGADRPARRRPPQAPHGRRPRCRWRSRSATCLALLSLGAGVGESTRGWFDDNHFDVWIQPQAGKVLDSDTGARDHGRRGVASAQPWLSNAVKVGDTDAQAWGLPARPLMDTRDRSRGAGTRPPRSSSATRVAVLGRTHRRSDGHRGRRPHPARHRQRPGATSRVIGISANQADNGSVVFVPVSALQSVLGMEGAFNNYFVTTAGEGPRA